MQSSRVRNDLFDAKKGLDRGRPQAVEILWYICKTLFFLSAIPWPGFLKRGVLRLFGARIGRGVVIKPRVNIHFPWKLGVGDFTWIGEEVAIINFEPVSIGNHCCLSQRVLLCCGNHDFTDPAMAYRNRPIMIEDGVWVGAQAFVAPGVTLAVDSMVSAGSVVRTSVPAATVCGGNPCIPLKPRWG